MDRQHRDHLYKRSGSPNWYVVVTHKGRQIRKSTGTKNYKRALQIAEEYHSRLQAEEHKNEWVSKNVTNEWLRRTLVAAKKRSRQRGMQCDLSVADLLTIATRSGGTCEVSGIPFSDVVIGEKAKKPFAASLDRIESSEGYHVDNCRLVCMVVNYAMSDWGEEVIDKMAKGIVLKMIESEMQLGV